ncbi:Hyaluronan synthase 1 [Larimichthys crocea]|uniref:Uncharacterized protein n=1 Tax=Larimichthys crocea TaxID=215358 RepID=A0ACD3QUE4_LARCR|nr:Hyaluronan synthase 1 [Larimichthys crocea]
MELKPLLRKVGSTIYAIFTFLFALLVLGVMVWAYVEGFQLATSVYGIITFGFYDSSQSMCCFRASSPSLSTGERELIKSHALLTKPSASRYPLTRRTLSISETALTPSRL